MTEGTFRHPHLAEHLCVHRLAAWRLGHQIVKWLITHLNCSRYFLVETLCKKNVTVKNNARWSFAQLLAWWVLLRVAATSFQRATIPLRALARWIERVRVFGRPMPACTMPRSA